MYRTLKMLVVCAGVYAIWIVPGSAFQLSGGSADFHPDESNPLQQTVEDKPSLDDSPLNLGESEKAGPPVSEGMKIWIPGLGFVGTMPKLPELDFGLEMLYGAEDPSRDDLGGAQDLKKFESEFSIKGTIKKKF